MAEARVPVRVLPSGKVYRQMFDAEVQLVNSLETSKPTRSRFPALPISNSIPQQTRPGDVLTDRQKSWVVGMPNDYSTENPVRYRQITAESAVRLSRYEPNVHIAEVQRLPNDIKKARSDSSVIDKIASRRQERHEVEVDKLHDELSTISTRIEPRIKRIGEELKARLEKDEEKIKGIFSEIEDDEELIGFSIELLEDLWKRADGHSPMRIAWIAEADSEYSQVENERFDAMSGVFRKYAAVLEKVAYLMPADVQKYIEKESMMANQGILANRRAYAKLKINLIESEIQRKMMLHLSWNDRVQQWKTLNADIAIKQFIDFMQSEKVGSPPEVEGVTHQFLMEQKQLEQKRKDILEQLLEFKPPAATKASVYNWNSALAKAQENIDQLHLRWIRTLNEKYENVCHQCLTEVDKYRENLTKSQVCSEERTQAIINEHMLPLIGERQRQFESELEKMDQIFESLAIRTEAQLKGLFKFVQGAAHLWDVHEIGLAKQERSLQNQLDESRQKHDTDNQERESKLDIILDRLRQESTEESLASFLQKSLEMLDFIYSGYEGFHQQQLEIINRYPDMVRTEIDNYDKTVCTFFNVNRNLPGESESQQTQSIPSIHSDVSLMEEKSRILYNTLTTAKGTSFYIIPSVDRGDLEDKTEQQAAKEEADSQRSSAMSGAIFLTEVSESGKKELSPHVAEVYMSGSDLLEYKKHIRLLFLDHLESSSEQLLTKAENLSRDKREELASELDLRKHLHEPRAKRIEVDVHNVRAAELVLHKERVSRHCKGITAALLGLKEGFQEMTKEHDALANDFRNKIEGMETVFVNSTKAARLVELTNSLHGKLDSYMKVVKASLRKFRQTLDGTLSRLRDSNAQCLKSFKLFSQGGNFSPEETVDLRKKLEKMSQRVDAAEGLIMHDLEGMESKRLDQATEIVLKFEDRFRNHMVDLTFIEKVQRWITNSQVRIKTEVQHCNGMGANIARHVKTVKSRIDACKFPNPDKEEISPAFLCEYAEEVMSSLHNRVDYLNCRLLALDEASPQNSASEIPERAIQDKPLSRQSSSSLPVSRQKGRVTATPKVGSHKPTPPSAMTPSRTELLTGGSTRKGQPQEDSAIGMIKSILRTQKGLEQEQDDVRSVMTSGARPLLSTAPSQTATSRTQKGSFNRQATLSSIAGSSTSSEKGKRKETDSRGNSGVYKRKETKFDIKHMVFGTKLPYGTNFELKIQAILYETLDGLLSTGELYYKQKGSRADSFDQYADVIVAKLLNYDGQTKEFHNMALQEFRKQLKALEEDFAEIPIIVLNELLQNNLKDLEHEQVLIKTKFAKQEAEWNKIKGNHKNTLRPTLGHPNQREILRDLMTKEENRQEENIAGIHENARELSTKAHDVTKTFLLTLSQTCLNLLNQFDRLLTIDDVNSGQIEIKREPTSILLRKKAAGIDLHDTSYKPSLQRGPKVWPGLGIGNFPNKEDDLAEVSEDINCEKTTLSHLFVLKKRDECLSKFMQAYSSTMDGISSQEELQLNGEQRWIENWTQSVKNVCELYET